MQVFSLDLMLNRQHQVVCEIQHRLYFIIVGLRVHARARERETAVRMYAARKRGSEGKGREGKGRERKGTG